MLYYTLYSLAEMADTQALYLAGKLQSAFFAYIFSAISVFAGILLAPIFVVFWIFSFILYIYILSKVRSAYKKIRETHTAKYIQPRKIRVAHTAIIVSAAVIPFLLGVGIIAVSELQPVETSPFIRSDTNADSNVISSTRSKLVELGFAPKVADSMPDSEILQYDGVKSVQCNKSSKYRCDGGELLFYQYVSSLDNGIQRYTIFYEWLKKPVSAHTEALGVIFFPDTEIVYLDYSANVNFSSLNLYDAEYNGKVQTRSSNDVKNNANMFPYVKKFKLADRNKGENYRGYIALNVRMAREIPYNFNNAFYYIRQSTIFNNRPLAKPSQRHCGLDPQSPEIALFEIAGQARNDHASEFCKRSNKGMDIIDFNKDKTYFSATSEDWCFKQYSELGLIQYEP